jgi:hypothetical protein
MRYTFPSRTNRMRVAAYPGVPKVRIAEGRQRLAERAADAGGRDVVNHHHGGVARAPGFDREIGPERPVQRIVERGQGTGRRTRGLRRAEAGRVGARQRDDLEAIAIIEIAADDGPHRVEAGLAPREDHESGTDPGAVHDADPHPAVDGGRVLGGHAERWTRGQHGRHEYEPPIRSHWRFPEK